MVYGQYARVRVQTYFSAVEKKDVVYAELPSYAAEERIGCPAWCLFVFICRCKATQINAENPERWGTSRHIARLKEERSGKFNPNNFLLNHRWGRGREVGMGRFWKGIGE